MMKLLIWFSSVFLVLTLCYPAVIHAQEATPPPQHIVTDDEVNAIAKKLYCPVCENTPLDVCPTQACAEWRDFIREKLAEGWSESEIEKYFVERFGDGVLETPPPRGMNWLIYIIPPLAFLAGVYLLLRSIRSWQRYDPQSWIDSWKQPTSVDEETVDLSNSEAEYVDRLEEELRRL